MKLNPAIENPVKYINEHLIIEYKNYLLLKRKIGFPYNQLQYYNCYEINQKIGSLKLNELHFQLDEMYLTKTIGMLESFHIHLLSHYIITKPSFKKFIYEKFPSLEHKNHKTGFISDNIFTGEKKVRFNSDNYFTEFLSTEFLVKELRAFSLLNENTLNKKFYDKILCEKYRERKLTDEFDEIKLYSNKNFNCNIKIIENYTDILNITKLISEIRNRILHRYHSYDSSSIVSNKLNTFDNFNKEYLFEPIIITISGISMNLIENDDLTINEKLLDYLSSKSLIIKPKKHSGLCYFDDEFIIQNLTYFIHKFIYEVLSLHWSIYELFIKEKLTTTTHIKNC